MENIYTKKDYFIETERLTLSLIKPEDANQLFNNMSNPEISKDMSWSPHEKINDTSTFIRSVQSNFNDGKSVTWCIRLKNDEKIIGIFSIISITRKHRELIYDKGEIAYWIDPSYEGKGFMTEAGNAVIEFGFNKLNLQKFFVAHHLNNAKSKKLIQKLNFEYTYTEKHAFMKNNVWIDVSHYELLKSSWHQNNTK